MIETAFGILIAASAGYLLAGAGVAVWFFASRIGRLGPPAAGGSLGFRVVVAPGVVVLWPLILMKALRPGITTSPDRAEELRRSHFVATLVLAVLGTLLFTAALAWRAPAFESLPETETTRP